MSNTIDLSVGAWMLVDDMSDGRMDTVYMPIPPEQKHTLKKAIQAMLDSDEYDADDTEYYMSQCLATHWLVNVNIPEECVDNPDIEGVTWWDFNIVVGAQVEGEWYAWCEDPSDISAVWFQAPYTRELVYKVRAMARNYIHKHGVYNELADEDDYCTSSISNYLVPVVERG